MTAFKSEMEAFHAYYETWLRTVGVEEAGRWLAGHVGELHERVEKLEKTQKKILKKPKKRSR